VISRDLPREAEMETARNEVRSGANEQGSAPAVNGHMPRIRKISAKSSQDSTRVTIELEAAVQYASGRIANPDRIYFDLHAVRLTPQLAHGTIKTDGTILSGVRVAQNPSGIVRVVLDVNGVTDYSTSLLNNPSRLVIDLYSDGQAVQTAKAGDGDSGRAENAAVSTEKPEPKAQTAPSGAVKSAKADTDDSVDTMPQPKSKLGTAKIGKSGGKRPELVQPAAAPQPTRDGQSTLTRTLGLKIGRIVIDAGHGGHDTGTSGATGLMEKDLCLDVALRLGKIIQQRLPGADVVF